MHNYMELNNDEIYDEIIMAKIVLQKGKKTLIAQLCKS